MVKDEKLAEFLRFVNRKWDDKFTTEDEFIKGLMSKVESIKKNEDWEREYMTMSATLDNAVYQGKMERSIEMATKMIRNNEPIEKIMMYSELSQSQIEELKAELSIS